MLGRHSRTSTEAGQKRNSPGEFVVIQLSVSSFSLHVDNGNFTHREADWVPCCYTVTVTSDLSNVVVI